MAPRIENFVGRRFVRLVIMAEREPRVYAGATHRRWLCRCDCGVERIVKQNSLMRGKTRSCGCLRKTAHTHGGAGTEQYRIYRGMIARCENPNVKGYSLYGGRGIKVCDRWRKSFPDFCADMGPRPSREHELDRISVDGDYEPGNVRWATGIEQANNRRRTRYVEYRGQHLPLTEAVRLAGSVIHPQAAWNRITHGGQWSVEDALETPPLFKNGARVPGYALHSRRQAFSTSGPRKDLVA